MAEYRTINEGNERDAELITELKPYLDDRMPEESQEAFSAWLAFYYSSNTAERSMDLAWDFLHPDTPQTPEDLEEWTGWKEQFRWIERSMVFDFQRLNFLDVQ